MKTLVQDISTQQYNGEAQSTLAFFQEQFQSQYEEGHLVLACHAAFPILLTPDLLYKIWLNFGEYPTATKETKIVKRIAVSDILLSPLCKEVGREQYEMQADIRFLLLGYLQQHFGKDRLDELAHFLLQYVQTYHTEDDALSKTFRESQEWTALAQLNPNLAAQKIAQSFAEKKGKATEQLRLNLVVERIVRQVESTNEDFESGVSSGFRTLLKYGKGLKEYIFGEEKNAEIAFNDLYQIQQKNEKIKDSIKIPIPKGIYNKIEKNYYSKENLKGIEKVKSHLYLGNYYFKGDKIKKAIKEYKKGLAIALNIGYLANKLIVNIYQGKGKCFLKLNKYKKAESAFKQGLKFSQKMPPPNLINVAMINNDLASCYINTQQYKKALKFIQKALIKLIPNYDKDDIYDNPKINQVHLKNYLLEILSNKAYAVYGLYEQSRSRKDLLFAYITFELVDKLIHVIRGDYQVENSKLFLVSRVHEIYDAALSVAYELYKKTRDEKYLRKCFEWAEMGKSNLLVNDIRKIDTKIQANIPRDLLEREESLRLELNRIDKFINQEIAKGKMANKKKIKRNEKKYEDYHTKYNKLIRQFESDYPDYYSLKYDTRIASIEELRMPLREDIDCNSPALIEYFVGEKYLYIFFITSRKFEVFRQKLSEKFVATIREFQDSIKKSYFTEIYRFIRSAYQLYQILFPKELQQFLEDWRYQPPEDNIGERLIIIPDKELATIPFEALLTKPTKNSEAFNELPYLIKDFSISYHYSATLWLNGCKKRNFATIDYDGGFIGFAPIYKNSQTKYAGLIYSEKEVSNIAKMFEKNNKKSHVYLGNEATKYNLKRFVSNFKYILISAYATYDAKHPERTHIVLYSNKERGDFSHFNISDAYNLSINAQLVVLSFSKSGLGQIVKGEGIMAMNRGFLYAGAENVISTLFKIYDKHSAELTQCFFELVLTKELSYTEALREAKLQLIQKGGYMPVHWAGFVLVGD